MVISASIFARVNPMVVPPLDNLHLDLHAFFVPARLVWDNWVKFMGEQKNPGDSIDYTIPYLFYSDEPFSFQPGSIYDYMGLPIGVSFYPTALDPVNGEDVNSLPLRAYNLIWNEWFRDQNFQNSVYSNTGDGPDDITEFELLNRGKRHDYFTSSLPSPQKGPQVTISLGGTAPVISAGDGVPTFDSGALYLTTGSTDVQSVNAGGSPTDFLTWNQPKLAADLASVTVLSINELRTAVSVQQLLEMYSRSGTRYTEILQAEFDVFPEDSRLQRPEFLGGSSQLVSFDAVPQTSEPTEDNPQGSLSSNGHVFSQLRFNYNVKEHGYLIILASVRADLTYQQGLRKMWSRRTRYDFYHPAFANLGEQAVLRKEFLYLDFVTHPDYNNGVWGYQERYAEYRYFPSLITGKFRSVDPQTLDPWHFALKYTSPVFLDANFIKDQPQLRALALPEEPAILVDSHFSYRHTRPMPVFSVPGLRRF